MANLEIDKREFDQLVGESIDNQKMIEEGSMLGAHWHRIEGNVCEVETYPNRPDLLSVEGLARAYRGFFDIDTGREKYDIQKGDLKVEVDESVEDVRPHIGGAVVRGLELSKKKINGLIQLQEKMHETMGRRRDKLAIGLHDLSTVEAPFTYKAVEPEKVSFKPLEYDKHMQLGEILDEHEKGQKYAWILEDEDRYPIIEDSEGKVLSFPPIINNQLTEVDSETTDIFIDVTGKHRETVMKALNILTTALSERGGQIESVTVDGEKMPDLTPEEMELDIEYFRDISGLDLEPEEIVKRLEMMKHEAKKKGDKIKVKIPAYRNDIIHQYDLIEEVVIAHRYDNIEPEVPEVDQMASVKPIQDFADRIRDVMTGAGALEANTFYLSSKEKIFEMMEIEENEVAEVANASGEEQEVVRNWLLPSLFQTLHDNRHHSYPQTFFEVSDVVELDNSRVGASNKKKMAYIVTGNEKDYTDARAILQVLERDLGLEFDVQEKYRSCFKESRSAAVYFKDKRVGIIGEFSEEVIENWELSYPAAGLELDVEKILELKE
ncbi:phenylalanine--tRNA ligase subunit beta [Candidatus Nanohalovita haloferacivicina]|uniref:phenylalanine--tRNA ligase subunit beta n=1 Tax=Candidatus Nanohalovita haloferacivicina TaxID=2978046 RepID=UPI00325FDF6D|nr:Phenylalanyl-tRNA synthetase beta subunit [Candidatus Nanohalobia archaeon BNXNv]